VVHLVSRRGRTNPHSSGSGEAGREGGQRVSSAPLDRSSTGSTDSPSTRGTRCRPEGSGILRPAFAIAHVARARGYGAGLWCGSNAPRRITGRRALGHWAAAGIGRREGWGAGRVDQHSDDANYAGSLLSDILLTDGVAGRLLRLR